MTDAEWALIEPFMPASSAIGRPRGTDLRAVVDVIPYIASSSRQRRALPEEIPRYSTVQGCFYAWSREGGIEETNHVRRGRCRRPAKDFEAAIPGAVARVLARSRPAPQPAPRKGLVANSSSWVRF